MMLNRSTRPVAAALAVLALTGCSGLDVERDNVDSGAPIDRPSTLAPSAVDIESPPAPAAERSGTVLEVAIAGERISPNNVEIRVGVGEPIVFGYESDREGELHVHSSPEQYIPFEVGHSKGLLVLESPGKIVVEDHKTGIVVARITVH